MILDILMIWVVINYEDGKTGVWWIVKMMISRVIKLTKWTGLKRRHYVLLAL